MTVDFPVTADGQTVGRVNISQSGLMLVFDCACNYRSQDILRLAAVCGGRYVPLGVMAPDAGSLRLKKSFTRNALGALGYRDPAAFHLIRTDDVYREPPEAEHAPFVPAGETPGNGAEPSAPADEDRTKDVPANEPEHMSAEPPPEPEPVVYNDFPDPTEYIYNYDDVEPPESEQDAGMTAQEPANFTPEPEPVPQDAVAPQSTINPESGHAVNDAAAAPDGWMYISEPGILFADESIRAICVGVTDALIMEQDGYVLLAVPVLPNEPFPLMPVFCFGSSGEVGGHEHIIFKIRDGNLTL